MMRLPVALLLAFAVILAACGDDGATEVSDTEAGTARPTEGVSVMDGPDAPPQVEGEPTVTASGLQIIILEEGTGATAEAGQRVSVHYTGWLADGTKFDSSLDRGQPFDFTLGAGQVIQGWDEGVAGMQAGGKRRLIIPPELAYGESGRGSIPPNAELTFDVELLGVE